MGSAAGGGTQNPPKLIMLHGWGADARIWQPLLQLGGLEAETWDLPGFGNACAQNQDLDTFLQTALARLPEQSILIGWSLGGMLACRLAALANDRVIGVVTLAANATFVQTSSWPWAMTRSVFTEFQRAFAQDPAKTFQKFCALQALNEPKAREVKGHLLSFAPMSDQTCRWRASLDWLSTLNNEQILMDLGVPHLHFFGRGDALVPVAAAEGFTRFPKARTEVLEHAGHCLPFTQPALLARRIDAFRRSFLPIDKQQIASSFSRSASRYEQSARVQRTLGKELLSSIKAPLRGIWLDLGCGTGSLEELLPKALQPECWLNGDIAAGMLAHLRRQRPNAQVICLDAESLPLARACLDGVLSNLVLQWCHAHTRVFEGIFASLRPGGTFIANTLLDGTLNELESAWGEVDSYTHVNRFARSEELKRQLLATGFEIESFVVKREVDWHPDFISVLKSLKGIGANNMNSGRSPGLNTRQRFMHLERAYEKYRAPDGRWPATYVVLSFTVKKP